MMNRQGRIYKATAGFYYVICEGEDLELACRARGLFRKQGQKPCVGDRVVVQLNADGSGTVEELLPRKNHLIRPPLANLDYMVVVLSVADPQPNLAVVDQYISILEHKNIEPLIVITKSDLSDPAPLYALYSSAGFSAFVTDIFNGEGLDTLQNCLAGKFSAFSGNSGVGKSSLLNAICPELALEVGETSRKLGRGKHTTRHTEIHRLPQGGFVADTPGFTALELSRMCDITPRELSGCFRDFSDFEEQCRFLDCAHVNETGCAVKKAVEDGKIAKTRHQSYCQIYGELKQINEWERRPNN